MVVSDPTRYSYHQKLFLIKFYFKLFQLTVRFWIKFNKIYFENYTVINGHLNSNVYKAVETNAFMKNFSQLAKLIDKSWRHNTRPEQQLVDLYWKICASASICFFYRTLLWNFKYYRYLLVHFKQSMSSHVSPRQDMHFSLPFP